MEIKTRARLWLLYDSSPLLTFQYKRFSSIQVKSNLVSNQINPITFYLIRSSDNNKRYLNRKLQWILKTGCTKCRFFFFMSFPTHTIIQLDGEWMLRLSLVVFIFLEEVSDRLALFEVMRWLTSLTFLQHCDQTLVRRLLVCALKLCKLKQRVNRRLDQWTCFESFIPARQHFHRLSIPITYAQFSHSRKVLVRKKR